MNVSVEKHFHCKGWQTYKCIEIVILILHIHHWFDLWPTSVLFNLLLSVFRSVELMCFSAQTRCIWINQVFSDISLN